MTIAEQLEEIAAGTEDHRETDNTQECEDDKEYREYVKLWVQNNLSRPNSPNA